MSITSIRHPEYNEYEALWEKYRYTYAGGQPFIDKYTKSFSKRETTTEFLARRASTYCPAHAKVAVNEIKDAICERLVDVVRIDGSTSYQEAIHGLGGGVDRKGSTMNGFISCDLLPELLSMGKVGVYIDRPPLVANPSRADETGIQPYVYIYRAEDIFAWDYDDHCGLVSILLRDDIYTKDATTGLPNGTTTRYRLLEKTPEGVDVSIYNAAGVETDTFTLALKEIPFVLFQIRQSLMTDIANYQIALLNLGSSDLSYAIKSNFPFYTEQFDPKEFMMNLMQAGSAEDANGETISAGTATEAGALKNNEINVGVAQGRKYPKGLDRPDFIHPSSEPLTASMAKQKDLQAEIRELVRLSVKALASSSGDTKAEDNKSVESGLACIGAELEKGERSIGIIWANYVSGTVPVIKYPKNYTLQTDAERQAEVAKLLELMPKLPSDELKKVVAKQIAQILVSHKVTYEELLAIDAEIDKAEVIITDPDVIIKDYEAGFVSTELASRLRGYPEGQVEQAKKDHADRILRIAMAQSSASGASLNASRGVDDADSEQDTAAREKTMSRETDLENSTADRTRGNADG
jgi:hypothetical protein